MKTASLPNKPEKPTIEMSNCMTKQSEQKLCLDKDDAVRLGKYIMDLEQGYD